MMRAGAVLHGPAVRSLQASELGANRWTCFVFNVALIMEKPEEDRISNAHLTKCIAEATPEMEALRCLPMEVPMLGKFVLL